MQFGTNERTKIEGRPLAQKRKRSTGKAAAGGDGRLCVVRSQDFGFRRARKLICSRANAD